MKRTFAVNLNLLSPGISSNNLKSYLHRVVHVEKCVDPVLGQWCSFGVSAHIEKDVFWRNYKWYKAQTFRKCYICDYL